MSDFAKQILPINIEDASFTFNIHAFNPSKYTDISYYRMDLSAIDPEGFDNSLDDISFFKPPKEKWMTYGAVI